MENPVTTVAVPRSRAEILHEFRNKFKSKIQKFNHCYRDVEPHAQSNKITLIRSLYLLLLRNRLELTETNDELDVSLHCPTDEDWDLVITSFYKAVKFKEYIQGEILANRTNPYNSYYRLVLLTMEKWQKHVHGVVLNDAVSYYKKTPTQFPTELKTHIVSYLISPHILKHL